MILKDIYCLEKSPLEYQEDYKPDDLGIGAFL